MPYFHFLDSRRKRRAVSSDTGQCARDRAERRADLGAEGCYGHDAYYGDQAYKHAVFDQSRALVIVVEPD